MFNTTQNTSRIQAHIYSLAGFHSFPRLTIAPTSPLYAAVTHLQSDLQGDEVYRGLAIALLSYFAALPKGTKSVLRELAGSRRANQLAPMMFDEMHAGDLASRMAHVENSEETAAYLTSALAKRSLSWVDVDVILPRGSISRATSNISEDSSPLVEDNYDYGKYKVLIDSFGSPEFLHNSQLQRAPSRPTARSKSNILSKDQKILLRQGMCELVDTENSYLSKIRELVDSIAADFRQSTAPAVWDRLFPNSLGQILRVNELFYQEVQAVLDNTESVAIRDIDADGTDGSLVPNTVTQDPTGAVPLAKALLKWFPLFKEPYQHYLRASNEFSNIITQAFTEASSTFNQHLQVFGEQRLRSTLIEPVQRLPRYSLLLDNIINLLPTSHPALAGFVKARDITTNICALDVDEGVNATRTTKVLRNIVANWPDHPYLRGRLIVAADVNELGPPYEANDQCLAAILLVFPGKLVILRKTGHGALSARGLMAEIDHPSLTTGTSSSGLIHERSLRLEIVYDLANLRLAESKDGHLIHLSEMPSTSMLPPETLSIFTRVFQLQAPYHGKAARFTKDIAKARIEARYPENGRENNMWALRSNEASEYDIGLVVAISEMEGFRSLRDRLGMGDILLVVDGRNNARSIMTNNSGTHVTACLTSSQDGRYVLEIEGADGTRFTDACKHEQVVPLLRKRLEELVHLANRGNSKCIAIQQVSFDSNVLRVVPLCDLQKGSSHRGFRPRSPVKLLSNMLGTSVSQATTPLKSRTRAQTIESVPALPITAGSRDYVPPARAESNASVSSKIALVTSSNNTFKSPLALLEDTFAAYMIALRSRSGNVVGKILQTRASADAVNVNELYNTLLETPTKLEAAAIVSVDVLFAAFEMFLRRAWRERMGPLVAPSVIKDMQSNFDIARPTMFAQYFKRSLEEMSPQNRRAFAATVKLLSDLLDASGSDGDRGVLIASFAEAVTLVGNPHDYIMLLDRLVDDYESLFDDVVAIDDQRGSTTSATSSLSRTRSVNTGSVSSDASSLRRKLGFGSTLSRENSKNEPESKVALIWRTLSKNARSPGDASQAPSLSKASLVRSRSTDTDVRILLSSRPSSRDRPPTSGSANLDGPNSRPGSSHLNMSGLSSIGEDTPSKHAPLPLRKKRRSSLSDLHSFRCPDMASTNAPLQLRQLDQKRLPQIHPKSLPKTPPSNNPAFGPQLEIRSTQRSGIPRYGSPKNKENSPLGDQARSKEVSPSNLRSPAKSKSLPKSDAVTITSYVPPIQDTSQTNIPAPKASSSDRVWPPNGSIVPSSTLPRSPQKMRVQSPQKLRQRLSQEQRTISTTEGSLQTEMNKIGEELSVLKLPNSSHASPMKSSQTDLRSLTSRLELLEAQLKGFMTEHIAKNNSFRSDLEASVVVSNKRARKLDELYKEANAENEALYDRFNDELGKILTRVRKGEGVEEVKAKLGEAQSEVRRLKGENAKLRREVVGLRSLMKGD
ncbi:MAG: hypothetical protein Q9217_004275 [Psora testacea]